MVSDLSLGTKLYAKAINRSQKLPPVGKSKSYSLIHHYHEKKVISFHTQAVILAEPNVYTILLSFKNMSASKFLSLKGHLSARNIIPAIEKKVFLQELKKQEVQDMF